MITPPVNSAKASSARLHAGIAGASLGALAMIAWGALTLSTPASAPRPVHGDWSGPAAGPTTRLATATLAVPLGREFTNDN